MYIAGGMRGRGRWKAWLLACLWMALHGALGLVLVKEDGSELEYKHKIAVFGSWKPPEDYKTKGIRGDFKTLEESDDLCGKLADSVDVKGKLVHYYSKVSPKDCNLVDVVCNVQDKKGVAVIIVWQDAANISLLNVCGDAQKPIHIPVVITTPAFVIRALEIIAQQGHAEVILNSRGDILNSRGDKAYETNLFATFLYTFLYTFVDHVFSELGIGILRDDETLNETGGLANKTL